MNDYIKTVYRIDSYYNPRSFRALNSNVYYQSIFQLHLDSLQILLMSEDQEIAALYKPHFESFLGYLEIYKDYGSNSPLNVIDNNIDSRWQRRQFINLMREFFSAEKPEFIIHFLGQMTLGEIPDIKASDWKFGKYPAHYTNQTKLKAMLIHHTNLIEYWNEFQQFIKLLEKHYPDGITKNGAHKIPRKKDICQMLLLNSYFPDLWLDLARISKKDKKDKGAITYLRIALCLDQTRYDIWKELIQYDPAYSNTNIPQLDDELNAFINNKIAQMEKQAEEEKQQELATGIVNQINNLTQRHNAFNEMANVMRSESTTRAEIHTDSASTNLPSYFKYLKMIPGMNYIEFFNKIENAIATLPGRTLDVLHSLERTAQQAFDSGKLDLALDTLLTIVHLCVQIGATKSRIQALCNLGIYFSNARQYEVARNYANEAKNIAIKNNLMEGKLHALKVLGLIQTNDNKDPRDRIIILEETAETLRVLGRENERQQILAQLEAFKQFLDVLGK
ncbi:MAG: hypothetical protein FK734_11985 [Asgard group archaeon]|nr:hypothetical protein [Asgard group archaeon]